MVLNIFYTAGNTGLVSEHSHQFLKETDKVEYYKMRKHSIHKGLASSCVSYSTLLKVAVETRKRWTKQAKKVYWNIFPSSTRKRCLMQGSSPAGFTQHAHIIQHERGNARL